MTGKILVVISCASREQALGLARHLVAQRLAACATVAGGVTSVYRWKGALEEAEETLVLAKSAQRLFTTLCDAVKSLHSYEVPEILALPVEAGLEAYLGWMDGELRSE